MAYQYAPASSGRQYFSNYSIESERGRLLSTNNHHMLLYNAFGQPAVAESKCNVKNHVPADTAHTQLRMLQS